MTSVLFTCEGAALSRSLAKRKYDYKIELNQRGKEANLSLQITNISGAILKDVAPLAEDLVRIASFVYAGDQSVSRGSLKDVYGHNWIRDLHFVIPVSDPAFWSREEIKQQLCDTLLFLTGDNFAFDFVKGSTQNSQLVMDLPGLQLPHAGADSVMLLSGGADSLGAVVERVAIAGKHPILVSHRSIPMLDNRQSRIAEELRRKFVDWTFPHISVWVHLKGDEAKDYTQRSRSFLFCALAATVAYQTGIDEVVIADNGIVSINIPKNGQLVGTYASRTTHPKFLQRTQDLFRIVFGKNIKITNQLQFKTRAEVMCILKENGCSELLQETVSCARTRQPAITPHCGVCSQCVDRRFGSISAEMEDYDLVDRYQVDIFTEEIKEGIDRTQVESYARFASHIQQLSDDSIYKEYVELFDCIIPGDPNPDVTARSWVNLLRRHAEQASAVMEDKIRQSATLLFQVALPESCLVRLVAKGSHLQEPSQQLALKVSNLLQMGIPKTFQSRKPKNEHEVQDAVEAILSAAHEELDRELPLLPFAGISTKPDYAKLDNSLFYVEMKYLKTRARLNQVVTEISSRVSIYEKQGAFALFAVYDPNHAITDDTKFIRDLSLKDHSMVQVIR